MQLRPAQLADMDLLYGLDHSYQTDHVWQLSNKAGNDEYSAILRLAKLPRPITAPFQHDATALRRTLHRADFVWVMEGEAATALGERNLLGYLSMTLLPWQNTAWVTSLAVRPDARRKGVATRLLQAANDQARSEGMHSLTADVATKNYPATRLCQTRGMRFTGFSENFYSAHDIALLFASRIR
jgi:GNAT superfamily N-acetyltransferase